MSTLTEGICGLKITEEEIGMYLPGGRADSYCVGEAQHSKIISAGNTTTVNCQLLTANRRRSFVPANSHLQEEPP